MSTLSIELINHLKDKDKEKISYFVRLLLKKKEYHNLIKELSKRKKKIKNNEVLSHDDIWNDLSV